MHVQFKLRMAKFQVLFGFAYRENGSMKSDVQESTSARDDPPAKWNWTGASENTISSEEQALSRARHWLSLPRVITCPRKCRVCDEVLVLSQIQQSSSVVCQDLGCWRIGSLFPA